MAEKESMLEKLTKFYHIYNELGAQGYVIGFYNEKDEIIRGKYEFPKGEFSIHIVNGNFFQWSYMSNKLKSLK